MTIRPDYQLNPVFIEDKLIDLENRSRWNNLRVNGIKERPNETWEDCEKWLDTLFKESLSIEEKVVIERVHRAKTDKSKKGNIPGTIVCRILNYKDKTEIPRNAKKLRGKNIFTNEDFCQAILDHCKELWKEAKLLRKEGKIAYLQYRYITGKWKDNTGYCLVKILVTQTSNRCHIIFLQQMIIFF